MTTETKVLENILHFSGRKTRKDYVVKGVYVPNEHGEVVIGMYEVYTNDSNQSVHVANAEARRYATGGPRDTAQIYSIVVDPKVRGDGIGSRLVDLIKLDYNFLQGDRKIRVDAAAGFERSDKISMPLEDLRSAQKRLISFYKRLGFEQTGPVTLLWTPEVE